MVKPQVIGSEWLDFGPILSFNLGADWLYLGYKLSTKLPPIKTIKVFLAHARQ